jgi:hypothetical protein
LDILEKKLMLKDDVVGKFTKEGEPMGKFDYCKVHDRWRFLLIQRPKWVIVLKKFTQHKAFV